MSLHATGEDEAKGIQCGITGRSGHCTCMRSTVMHTQAANTIADAAAQDHTIAVTGFAVRVLKSTTICPSGVGLGVGLGGRVVPPAWVGVGVGLGARDEVGVGLGGRVVPPAWVGVGVGLGARDEVGVGLGGRVVPPAWVGVGVGLGARDEVGVALGGRVVPPAGAWVGVVLGACRTVVCVTGFTCVTWTVPPTAVPRFCSLAVSSVGVAAVLIVVTTLTLATGAAVTLAVKILLDVVCNAADSAEASCAVV
eukprot:CAMPEP_0175304884 /NCGR_PEP_ID=MMETSP0093-20121207/63464_1 /TAXON_ID=311494 /ORGANISM="Alexandrium monilatum, Strain CCMP3105" /LENGTH=251 /DNA_ID=CAMNT_0016601305 /DNA_START=165 /DNA_END=920 /DNA_ORIENTATION=+